MSPSRTRRVGATARPAGAPRLPWTSGGRGAPSWYCRSLIRARRAGKSRRHLMPWPSSPTSSRSLVSCRALLSGARACSGGEAVGLLQRRQLPRRRNHRGLWVLYRRMSFSVRRLWRRSARSRCSVLFQGGLRYRFSRVAFLCAAVHSARPSGDCPADSAGDRGGSRMLASGSSGRWRRSSGRARSDRPAAVYTALRGGTARSRARTVLEGESGFNDPVWHLADGRRG